MIGIVLVAHEDLASALLKVVEHVVGRQPAMRAVCVMPDDDMEQCQHDIAQAVADVDGGDGVVVLTDMFGGTPSNLAIAMMRGAKVEVISGVNVPMLIKLVSVRTAYPLAQAVLMVQEAGRKYIHVASQLLKPRA